MSGTVRIRFFVLVALLAASHLMVGQAAAMTRAQTIPEQRPVADWPTPPEQPASGPGGSQYRSAKVGSMESGQGAAAFWLFVPADESGAPVISNTFPLVTFLHGFSATEPSSYLTWINHIVQRGAVVVYPIYQVNAVRDLANTSHYLANAETAVREAVAMLDGISLPTVNLDNVAVVGHSAGGVLAANYAFDAAKQGLPEPTVLFFAMPGGCQDCDAPADVLEMPLELEGDVSPDTFAIAFVGDDDDVVGDGAARRIWDGVAQLPDDQRDYVTLHTDHHGRPTLQADHLQPVTDGPSGAVDAYDWYGTWKLLDALMSCRFQGTDCEYALGNTPEQRNLGQWSDGTPVIPLTVTDTPA
jgi:pimeloyl-ACP methyl ester carboxylesterase